MTISGQSTGYHYAVDAIFHRSQGKQCVQFPRAGQLDNFNLGRVLHSEPARQVGCRVSAVLTTVRQDLEGNFFHYLICPVADFFMLLLTLLFIACNRYDQFGLYQRCDHCSHLVIGVMHQLNSLGGALSRAGPAALAGRRLDVCRPHYAPGSNQV